MATKASSDGEHATTSTEYEKEGHTAAIQQVDASSASSTSDIDLKDLPKGYYLRPYFIGTLIASGLSVGGVRSPSLLKATKTDFA
jgi:hypothetical protein